MAMIQIRIYDPKKKKEFRSESFSQDGVNPLLEDIRERQKLLEPKIFSNQKVKIK